MERPTRVYDRLRVLACALSMSLAACAGPEAATPAGDTALAEAASVAPRRLGGIRLSAGPAAPLREHVSFKVDNMSLPYLVTDLAGEVGRGIVVDPRVDETITLEIERQPWKDAIATVAELTGCELHELPGGTLVLRQPPLVSLQGSDIDLRTLLRMVGSYVGVTVLMTPHVGGSIEVPGLTGVPYGEAFRMIAALAELRVRRKGDVFLVAPGDVSWGTDDLSTEQAALPAAPPVRNAARVDVDVFRQPLEDAVRELGARVGRDLRAPGLDVQVSVFLRDVPWTEALQVLALLGGCQVRARGDALVLDRPPRNLVQLGREVPARPWFELLARRLGLELDMPAGLDRLLRVGGELREVRYVDLANLTAELNGLRVGQRDGKLLVRAGRHVLPARPGRGLAVAGAGGALRTVAICRDETATPLAIVGDRLCGESDRLAGDDAVVVRKILPGVVRVLTTDGERDLFLD